MQNTARISRVTNNLAQQYLRCPVCYGRLDEAGCTACQTEFPQTMGIPDLRWPRPAEADASEDKLVALIVENFAVLSFMELTSLWFQAAAQDVGVPEDMRGWMEEYHSSLQERGRQMVGMFVQQTKRYFNLPAQTVALDIGCGVGASSIALMQEFDVVVGIDVYLPSLLIARKFLEEQGIHNIVLAQAYAQRLPLAAQMIDYGVAQNVLEHLFTVEEALHDIRRVLKACGCFCADSRNRFDLFLPEPHARLRWVGLWPRRWQPWYVWRFRKMPYELTYLLSLGQLKRFARAAFGRSVRIVFPMSAAYGRDGRWDGLIETLNRIPVLNQVLLAIFPSHLLIVQAEGVDRHMGGEEV